MAKAPIVDVLIKDESVLKGAGLIGAVMVQLYTLKGAVATPLLVTSWIDFTRKFGEMVDKATSIGTLEIKKALDGGAPLYIGRAGHYTDPTDKATLTGTKADAVISGVATTAYAIDGVTAALGGPFVHNGVDVTAAFPKGSVFAVTGSTGNDGNYTVVSSVFSTNTTITVVETVPNAVADGNMDASTNNAFFEAFAIGTGYNGNIVTISAPASGLADVFDITVDVLLHDELQEVTLDFPKAPTATDINNFNAGSKEVVLISTGTEIEAGTDTFANGDQPYAAIVDADWVGDNNAQTGIYAFNVVTDAIALAVPEKAEDTIDLAVSNYTKNNWYKAIIRVPIGLSSTVTIDYRDKTGAYAGGTILDDWRTDLIAGGAVYNDADTQSEDTDTSGIGGVIAAYSKKHQDGIPWFSHAGKSRGVLAGAKDVVVNHGTPANIDNWALMTGKGINAIVPKSILGVDRPTYWGNRTLQKALTLLQASNIADLVLFLRRELLDILEDGMFDPLDTDLWKSLYNKAKTDVLNPAADGRGLRGGEGEGWVWQGDQFVNDVADAVINTPSGLDNGEYKVKLFIKPIRATEFIELTITIKDSGADISIDV